MPWIGGGISDVGDRFLELRQRAGHGREQRGQILALAALAPVLEDHVGGAGIGERGVVVEHRDAADRHHLGHARRVLQDLGDLGEGGVGALARGALGHQHAGDHVALILDRDEARGQLREAPDRDAAEADPDDRQQQAAPHHAGHEADEAALGGAVDALEAAPEPAAVPAAPGAATARTGWA